MVQSTPKTAYPNFEQMQYIADAHDMNKWLQAVKTLYYEEKKNQLNRKTALQKVTHGWNVTEVNDFVNWLRFYEEGTHLKYKVAQNWYGDADIGYLLPIKHDVKKEDPPSVSGQNIDFARDAVADELSSSEKKRIIEKQRNKIIGRLDSAEKLLRSNEGQLFADTEFASLLETIYELKKKIQMVNKRSSSVRLYEDMIVREANILTYKGFIKAANILHAIAEDKPEYPKSEDIKPDEKEKKDEPKDVATVPSAAPPNPPTTGEGSPVGLPATPVPPSLPQPAAIPKEKETKSVGVEKFLEGLDPDLNKLDEDVLEVLDSEGDLMVEAQVDPETAAKLTPEPEPEPEPAPAPAPEPEPEPKENLEVKENEPITPSPAQSKDFDNMVQSIFSNLTISDVVAKFEDIAKFYKTREMPRQLALADMMLDSLGLAPFFPALSEATNKALEANNYISTRLEDIISKLRGTMKTREIDMTDEEHKKLSPELEEAASTLKSQEEQEKAKKKLRKDLEDQSLQEQIKETPEVDITEDLGTPPPPPAAPPPPAKPPTV